MPAAFIFFQRFRAEAAMRALVASLIVRFAGFATSSAARRGAIAQGRRDAATRGVPAPGEEAHNSAFKSDSS